MAAASSSRSRPTAAATPRARSSATPSAYANAATLGNFPLYTFTAQPRLTYGTTYHLVFEQVAASQGMTSVNDLADWVAPPDGLSIFPLQKSTLASIRYQNNAWKVMPGQIPIYELTYADGTAKGQPMMGGGRPDQQPIAGGNMARQSFDMYGPSATVYGIYFALYRTAAVGPLTIRITNSSNKVLFQTSVDGNQVSTSSSGDTSPLHWLYVPTSPTTFAAGGIYYVSFQAAAGGGLWALPINNGYFYGFRNSSAPTSTAAPSAAPAAGPAGAGGRGPAAASAAGGACRSSSRPSPESPDSRHRAPGVWLPAGSAGGVNPPGTREQRRCRAGARSPTKSRSRPGRGPVGSLSARDAALMKIIDLKCAVIGKNPIVRIVTDEGISGYGEVE